MIEKFFNLEKHGEGGMLTTLDQIPWGTNLIIKYLASFVT